MAAVDVGARHVPPVPAADDLDDLYNYDIGDVFRDVNTNIDVSAQHQPAVKANGGEHIAGLGIDEEIKVTKKRAPVPKLDENRLLGPAGIPKLRRITRDRLKLKGKGHEYSDVTRLLNLYQLWLDELYPRAKFADGLTIIERLGHTKRMQTMRREWINEGKPRERLESTDSGPNLQAAGQTIPKPREDKVSNSNSNGSRHKHSAIDGQEDDYDDFDTGKLDKNESRKRMSSSTDSLFVSDGEDVDDEPPEDDLDALLAEDSMHPQYDARAPLQDQGVGRENAFDDEMEAMADMDDLW